MAVPTPAEESVELFNTLLRTVPSDQDAVQRILWRGRQLERKRPNDFRIRVVLATAYAMGEDPPAAMATIERIGELWVGQERDPIVSFLEVLLGVWDLESAKQVANALLQTSLRGDIVVVRRIIDCAIALGDCDWLNHLSILEKEIPGFQRATAALDVIAEGNLCEHFEQHQGLVRKHVAGIACVTAHAVFGLEDDAPFIAANVFAAADRATCRRFEQDISMALANYYELQGLSPGVYIPYFTAIISPLATAASAIVAA